MSIAEHNNLSTPEISAIVDQLRTTFKSGKTRDRAWRIKTLQTFQKMMVAERSTFQAALKADLNKSPEQSWLTELNLIEQDIQLALDHLDEWSTPTAVSTDIVNLLGAGQSEIHHEPLGVICIYGAWNYPFILTLQPIVGAIAAGNCVLVKTPSPKYSKHSADTMLRICNKYFDTDTIRFVGGGREVTQSLFTCRFDHCLLTGSVANGKRLARACAEFLTPCTLELGGKSPCIVDKNCNVATAAQRATWGSVLNSGQTCIRPDYNFVHRDVAEEFIKETIKTLKAFHAGDSQNSNFYGRMVNEGAWDRVTKLLEPEKTAGRIRYGGHSDRGSRYIEPTIVDFENDWDAFAASGIMADEVFGPIIPVVQYTDLNRIIEFINDHEKPLVAHVFTNDSKVADDVLRFTSSGSACINDAMIWMSNHDLPFGGVGNSGQGAYHGKATFDLFSHHKSVLRKTLAFDFAAPWRYPPYDRPMQMTLVGVLQYPYSGFQKNLLKWAVYVFLFVMARRWGMVGVVRDVLIQLLQML
jgi:aldehyde dehydrogenase (NAD+)